VKDWRLETIRHANREAWEILSTHATAVGKGQGMQRRDLIACAAAAIAQPLPARTRANTLTVPTDTRSGPLRPPAKMRGVALVRQVTPGSAVPGAP
jgi:hypothetical protein